MAKQKRKLTPTEKAEKRRRRQEFMTIFVGGKQKRVKRPPTIDGVDVEEFIRRNADPIWLHQNEMWEYMNEDQSVDEPSKTAGRVEQSETRHNDLNNAVGR